ncbi:MAG TPA: ATP-binding cassette domain-containing protein, partial [Clostridia bacterium]|nr:ATP-binding cassette domain-containing protein [Clostridia bacterium]
MRIETQNLCKAYVSSARTVQAVFQAGLNIGPGETVGLLGDSGCGKSTLGLMLVGLLRPDEGTVRIDGTPVRMPYQGELRKRTQILFQHPEVSFNPRRTLLYSLREPYRIHRMPFHRRALCAQMESFGLYEHHLGRYPHELSGGELQRAALVRILSLQPSFIV